MLDSPLKIAVRSLYDAQKLRIEMSNRISAQTRAEVLSEEWEQRLRFRVKQMQDVEKELLKDVGALVKDSDIWPWLKEVKGCGPAMSGVLISELVDPARFDTVSKLWAYCGLHVIDGRRPRRKKGQKTNWNGFLKTKLMGVLSGCFLKATTGDYRDYYYNYRKRIESRPCSMTPAEHKKGATAEALLPNGCTNGHMHNKALGYMVKMFLADLWEAWRTVRGLPVRPTYAEEYLPEQHASRVMKTHP